MRPMPQRRVRRAVVLALVGLSGGVALLQAAALAERAVERAVLATLGFEFFLALLAVAGACLQRIPLPDRLGLRPGRLSWTSLAVLAFGMLALSHALDALLDLSGLGGRGTLADLEDLLSGARGPTLALALVGIGIAPGVAEELLCRGLIQRGLQRRLGTPASVIVAALVFGALHVDPVHAAVASVLGVYLGLVAVLAGSVRAAIGCHVVNNAVAVVLVAWLGEPETAPLASLLLGSSAAIAALGLVWRRAGGAADLPDTHSAAPVVPGG